MTVQRYVLKELLLTFIITFLCLSLVIIMGFSIQQLQKYKGVGVGLVMKLIPYIISYVVSYTLPVSLLLSCIFVYKRMAEEFELTALRATGISKQEIARPTLLLALPACMFLLYFHGSVLPKTHFIKANIGAKDLSKVLTGTTKQKKVFDIDHTIFRFEKIEQGLLYGVHILEMYPGGPPKKWFVASRGQFLHLPTIDNPTLEFALEEVTLAYWENPEDQSSYQTLYFKDEPFVYRRNMREAIGVQKREIEDMTFSHLAQLLRTEKAPSSMKNYSKQEILIELLRRYALSLSPLVFVLLAAPLAMKSQSIGSFQKLGLLVILVLLLFYPLVIVAGRIAPDIPISPMSTAGYSMYITLFFAPHALLLFLSYLLTKR